MNTKRTAEEIIAVCTTSSSMLNAQTKLGLPYSTFKRKAVDLGVYKINQGRKGIKRYRAHPITDYLEGKRKPSRHAFKLRLIQEGLKPAHCEKCGLSKWLGEEIPLELDHIDRDGTNNALTNLMILCPTCHAIKTRKDRKTKKVKTC